MKTHKGESGGASLCPPGSDASLPMMTMQVNPEERLSARQALMHPWLTRPATKELESAHAAFKVGSGSAWEVGGAAAGERGRVSPPPGSDNAPSRPPAGEVRWEGLCCRVYGPGGGRLGLCSR